MRPKFRAWHTKAGEYVAWPLLSDGFTREESGCFVPNPIFTNFVWEQYTGLKDKNGVEIFEGDIVELSGAFPISIGAIRWDQEFAGFEAGCGDEWVMMDSNGAMEVVGNIHDSPGLLPVGESK